MALLCHKGVSIAALSFLLLLSIFSQSWSWVLGFPVIAFSQSKFFSLVLLASWEVIVEGMLTSSIMGMVLGLELLLLLLLLVLLLFLLSLEVIVLLLPSEFQEDDFLLDLLLDFEVLDPPFDHLELMVDP